MPTSPLVEAGLDWRAGPLAAIGRGRRLSDLFAPVTGKVVKVNDPLGDSPEYINEDCYDEGWMVQVEMKDPKELDGLMDEAAYKAHTA